MGRDVDVQWGHDVRVVDRGSKISDVVEDDPGAVTERKVQKSSTEEQEEGEEGEGI